MKTREYIAIITILTLAPINRLSIADDVSFNEQIRPIFSKYCFACHGPDEETREADLQLNSPESTAQFVEAGDPDQSELFLRIIATDRYERMPPPDHSDALTPDEIELVRQWIINGAHFQVHWSFVAPQKSELPKVQPAKWPHNEIDHFVAARLSKQNLNPSKQADPYRLIRRLAIDLTGLPPDQSMVQRFAQEPNLQVYEKIVDELLAKDAYGEHWAAMWLDLARYADTAGYAEDRQRTIWPWRDWVIRAFNANMPFDQFSIEQLAGDQLSGTTKAQQLATAFHRNTLNNSEGGTSDEEFRVIAVKDRINTTINVWMGLTMRCAECHSHKYDPINQTEYYQFLDLFNQTADADTTDEKPWLDLFPDGRETFFERIDVQIGAVNDELAKLDSKVASHKTKQAPTSESGGPESGKQGQGKQNDPNQDSRRQDSKQKDIPDQPAPDASMQKLLKQRDALRQRLAALVKQRTAPLHVPVMRELPSDKRRETRVMIRGNYLSPGDLVTAGVPRSFHSMPASAPLNRLGVAQWLFNAENPLTARVAVNRFWARLFGTGIVETEEDFGTQGSIPTHPQLLDWLAVDFRENGWDVKRLLRQIVMSSTYRQESRVSVVGMQRDPRNRWLSRGPRNRLRAEVVRDQALAVSGLLSKKMYGPPVFPPNPIKQYVNAFTGGMKWQVSEGRDRYRRAVYTFMKRSAPHPLFETFDMATREVCNLRRLPTNTPLQSFMTLHHETFVEAAQALARKIHDKGEAQEQIARGLSLALLRPGEPEHIETLSELYRRALVHYRNSPPAARQMAGIEEGFDEQTAAELASLTVVSNVILNLDAFLTK